MQLTMLAQNLRFLRKEKGWLQSEIEARCGFRQRNWSNWENAVSQPDLTNIIGISQIFGVSIDDLLTKDLSENVHLIKNEGSSETPGSVHLNVHPNVHPIQEKARKGDMKEQTDLLILKQLNYLSEQVSEVLQKIGSK